MSKRKLATPKDVETELSGDPNSCPSFSREELEAGKFNLVPVRPWHKSKVTTKSKKRPKVCKKLDFENPESPIQTYVENWNLVKAGIAECECSTKVEVCNNYDFCVCEAESRKTSPSQLKCGCRVKKCKPFQAAQKFI